jgi:hypothetical protein
LQVKFLSVREKARCDSALPIELVRKNAFKGGGRKKKERTIDGEEEEGEGEDEMEVEVEGGEKREKAKEVLSPAVLTSKELAATKSVYTLDQLKRMSVDTPSFLYCMQKMNFVANKLCCGRYRHEHVFLFALALQMCRQNSTSPLSPQMPRSV